MLIQTIIGFGLCVALNLPVGGVSTERYKAVMLPGPKAKPIPAQKVRRLLAKRLGRQRAMSLVIPYEADEGIKALAARITHNSTDEEHKLQDLRRYFHENGFLEKYDRDGLYTARQVMKTQKGNCLSYANLFVALARSAGLRANYLDASAHDSAFGKSGSVLVQWGHVLVGVQVGSRWVAVEFDGRMGRPQKFRLLSDLEVVADYYNNMGSQLAWDQKKPGGFGSEDAIEAFRMATKISPRFIRAWNNLGVALSRAGKKRQALWTYWHTIELAPDFAPARANLAQLLRHNGKTKEAITMFTQAVNLDPENAHFRYFLGRSLAEVGNYKLALEHLKKGISLDEKLFLIRLQMAWIFERQGRLSKAAQQAQKILETIPGQRDAKILLRRMGV